jgi:hypothetical protein
MGDMEIESGDMEIDPGIWRSMETGIVAGDRPINCIE